MIEFICDLIGTLFTLAGWFLGVFLVLLCIAGAFYLAH